jgi:hypothetical protein
VMHEKRNSQVSLGHFNVRRDPCDMVAWTMPSLHSISCHVLSNMSEVTETPAAHPRSLTYYHKSKYSTVMSGEREGQAVGSSLPTQRSGKFFIRVSRTCKLQCGGAPPYW